MTERFNDKLANRPFLVFDFRALWRSTVSARALKIGLHLAKLRTSLHFLIDWLIDWGFTSHSTLNGSFRRRSSQPISWLSTELHLLTHKSQWLGVFSRHAVPIHHWRQPRDVRRGWLNDEDRQRVALARCWCCSTHAASRRANPSWEPEGTYVPSLLNTETWAQWRFYRAGACPLEFELAPR